MTLAPTRRRRSAFAQGRWTSYVFVAPFVIVFCLFTLWPLGQSVRLSMQQTFGPRSATFVGTRNFQYLFTDPLFWKAVRNTCVFAAGSLFVQLPCSLGLAMLLNRPNLKGRAFFRLIFFAPSLVGLVFVAIIAGLVFEKHTGLLNVALHDSSLFVVKKIGLFNAAFPERHVFDLDLPWLDRYVMPAIILAALWVYVGFNMVYFLAALQNVSRDLIEASMIDGASKWEQFRNVTIPAIKPVASFVVLMSLIGSFQLFELPYVLLSNGGGPDNQGLTVVMYLYQTGFQTGDLGYASAIGWVLAIALAGMAFVHRRLSRNDEAEAA